MSASLTIALQLMCHSQAANPTKEQLVNHVATTAETVEIANTRRLTNHRDYAVSYSVGISQQFHGQAGETVNPGGIFGSRIGVFDALSQ
jgi:hypothetical protein